MRKAGCIIGIVLVLGAMIVLNMMRAAALKAAAANGKKDATVQKGNVAITVIDTGTISPVLQVEVKSRVQGRLKALYVKEGDYVKKGQVIALIDPEETKLQVAQNQAQYLGAMSNLEKAKLLVKQKTLQDQEDLQSAKAQLKQAEINLKVQPSLSRAAVNQAEAQLKSAEDDQQQLLTNTIPTLEASTQSALQEAQANLSNSSAQLKRDQDLYAKGFVSKKTVEDDELQNNLSLARLQTAKVNSQRLHDQIQAQTAKAAQAVAVAKANLASANANLAQIQIQKANYKAALANEAKARAALQDTPIMKQDVSASAQTASQFASSLADSQRLLGYTEVTAPVSGIVTKREIQVGELVSSLSSFSSGTPIVLIEDRSKMLVKMDVNEIDVAKMRVGMKADVSVDAFPNDKFTGTVTRIDPSSLDSTNSAASSTTTSTASTNAVVQFAVEVTLNGDVSMLRSGMSAKCSLTSAEVDNVLYAPVEDIGHDSNGSFLMVLPTIAKAKGGKPAQAVRESVTLGLTNGTFTELKSGATEGQVLERPKFTGPSMQGMMQFGGGN